MPAAIVAIGAAGTAGIDGSTRIAAWHLTLRAAMPVEGWFKRKSPIQMGLF
jgi:hypothetical protein